MPSERMVRRNMQPNFDLVAWLLTLFVHFANSRLTTSSSPAVRGFFAEVLLHPVFYKLCIGMI